MGLPAEAIRRRRGFFTASDCAALFNKHPFRNLLDVYFDKTTQLETFEDETWQDWGHREEELLLDMHYPGWPTQVWAEKGIFGATIDALHPSGHVVVDAKTVGVVTPINPKDYGWEDDRVAPHVYYQLQQQMLCAEAQDGVALAHLGGRMPKRYPVERNDKVIAQIIEKGTAFWNDHVLKRIPPPDEGYPSATTLKRIKVQDGARVQVPNEVIDEWVRAKELRLNFEKLETKAFRAVRGIMGDAEYGECDLGTLRMQKISRKEYTVKAGSYRKADWREAKEEVVPDE